MIIATEGIQEYWENDHLWGCNGHKEEYEFPLLWFFCNCAHEIADRTAWVSDVTTVFTGSISMSLRRSEERMFINVGDVCWIFFMLRFPCLQRVDCVLECALLSLSNHSLSASILFFSDRTQRHLDYNF